MRPRPNLIPAGLLVAAAILLFLRPLACRGATALVQIPDDGPILIEDSGPDSGPDDGGDGGYHSDSGCEIRGKVVLGGTWLNVVLGSCTVCDPQLNPNGWTVFDSGEPCRGFESTEYSGPLTVPFEGVCGFEFHPFGNCTGAPAGLRCNLSEGFGCAGGVCGASGWCEVTQNLGYLSACAIGGGLTANACADGPCCPDGGYKGILPDGGGWCCGLIDGGVSNCLAAGNFCVADSNCCGGLLCLPSTQVMEGDAGGYWMTCQ